MLNEGQKTETLEEYLRPNLMNLSGGLNLSGRSNMLGSTKNCIQFFNFNFWREMIPVFGGFKPRLKFIITRHVFS